MDKKANPVSSSNVKSWKEKLPQIPFFQRLPVANIALIIEGFEEVPVREGHSVFNQGDTGDYFYVLLKGRCRLTRKPSNNSKVLTIAELKAGSMFGENALISGSSRNVSVKMITDGKLLRLEKKTFLELIKKPVIRVVEYEVAVADCIERCTWLDVRSSEEHNKKRLPNTTNIPFFSLRMAMGKMSHNERHVIICDNGKTSEAAAFQLAQYGIDAVVIKGGLSTVPDAKLEWFSKVPLSARPKRRKEDFLPSKAGSPEKEYQLEMEGTVRQLKKDLAKKAQGLNLMEDKIKALGNENAALKNSRAELVEKTKAMEMKAALVAAEIRRDADEFGAIRDKLPLRESELEELRGKHAEYIESFAKYKALLAEKNAQLAAVVSVRSEMSERLGDLVSKAKQSKDEFDQRVEKLQAELKERDDTITQLREQTSILS